MTPKRKIWRKEIQEAGVTVYLFERAGRASIYREVRTDDGKQDRRALGHSNRQLAEEQARELAKRIAELRFAGQTGSLTLGQLTALYLKHKGPLVSTQRKKGVESMTLLLERHFGRT